MPNETINGVSIYLEEHGSGDPLVLVHGSWDEQFVWASVVPLLAQKFRVTVYDRRGHGRSEHLPGQGSVHEDVADLAAVIEAAGAPAHVVANSFGASISLRLLGSRPELVRTLCAHEPPLFGLLSDDPGTRPLLAWFMEHASAVAGELQAGNLEEGTRLFVEAVIGPGTWDLVPPDGKQMMVGNALTFLDETRDPDALSFDLAALTQVNVPVLLSGGTESPPAFVPVLNKLADALPNATRETFAGAGHVPHETHPQEYAAALMELIGTNDSA